MWALLVYRNSFLGERHPCCIKVTIGETLSISGATRKAMKVAHPNGQKPERSICTYAVLNWIIKDILPNEWFYYVLEKSRQSTNQYLINNVLCVEDPNEKPITFLVKWHSPCGGNNILIEFRKPLIQRVYYSERILNRSYCFLPKSTNVSEFGVHP